MTGKLRGISAINQMVNMKRRHKIDSGMDHTVRYTRLHLDGKLYLTEFIKFYVEVNFVRVIAQSKCNISLIRLSISVLQVVFLSLPSITLLCHIAYLCFWAKSIWI